MSDAAPPLPCWYHELISAIQRKIEGICSLYPPAERPAVLFSIVSAIHKRASEIDPSCSWLLLALDNASDQGININGSSAGFNAPRWHPAIGDAEDTAEDISRMNLPCGHNSSLVAIRAAVQVAWTSFAPSLHRSARAILAAEAAQLV